MADGYVGLFLVPEPGVPIPILTNLGSISVEEIVSMKGGTVSSQAKISLGKTTSVQLSAGRVSYISIERKKDGVNSVNIISFVNNPSDGDTITLGDGVTPRVYTFKNTLGAVNQIKIGDNINETLINFVRTINVSGTPTEEYYTGQTIDPNYSAHVRSSRTAQLKVKAAGTGGDSYTVATSNSTAIKVYSNTSFGGVDAPSDYEILGNYPVYQVDGNPGWTGTEDNEGVFIIPDMPFSNTGINWKFRIKFFNSDGQQGTNGSGIPQALESSTVIFNGIDELADYAEVVDLKVSNASNVEGVPSPGTPASLPPGGLARLEWADMSKFTTKLQNHRCADGGTRAISEAMLSGINEYVVFMFKSAGTSNPTNPYPSPPSDSAGSWFLVARTRDCWAEVQCPTDTRVAFWVGFGVEGTAESSEASKIPTFPYAEYSS